MKQAGADEIWGVDIQFQPQYPFWFLHANALKLDLEFIKGFDFVWASPPCQAYSFATHRWRNSGREWPDLVWQTRGLLRLARVPFVIENVLGAPLNQDLMLCGEMFDLGVIRHRIFEIYRFHCQQPEHRKHKGLVKNGWYVTVAGNGGNYTGHNFCKLKGLEGASQLETWQFAMGIDWITDKRVLREAVPPAYAEYIFASFLSERRIEREPGSDDV